MFWMSRPVVIVVALLFLGQGAPRATRAETAQQKLHHGFYLEQAQGDCAAAAELYRQVEGDRQANDELQAEAAARLVACREELAAADFTRLVPETTLAYLEIKRPGDQLLNLLGQLGLLAGDDAAVAATGRRVAVSPTLIKELVGIGGAALAVTGFDPLKQKPSGVAIFHPGDVEVIRGLIATGLPVGGRPVEPIGGFPTYEIEGETLVTLTSRLVIASPQRAQIEAVLRRLTAEETTSLATNAALKGVLEGRGDSLLFFCLNAEPLMPLLNGMMAAAGSQNPELAMARAVLDLDSLRSLSGRAGVNDAGVFLDLALRLDEGHHNLVYNLLRTPPFNWDTLKCVPEGAAGILVGALNEAPSRHAADAAGSQEVAPVITAFDFGREIFANITSLAVFALPPDGQATEGALPVPDLGAAVTVNDPAKSSALWMQVLGIASLASGGGTPEGRATDIDGVKVFSYSFPESVTVHFASVGNDVFIAASRSAMARTIHAKRSGRSIVDDPGFAEGLKRLAPHTTKGLFLHAGRCAQIAKRFAPAEDMAEIEPFLPALETTVASLVVNHSAGEFQIGAFVSGLPQIGPVVAQMIEREQLREQKLSRVAQALRSQDWNRALEAVDELRADDPHGDIARATANLLNNAAWAMLTDGECGADEAQIALKLSERSNDMTGHGNWAFVDTLALARFKTGAVSEAVSLEKKAIELADGAGGGELEEVLARFEAALKQERVAGDSTNR